MSNDAFSSIHTGLEEALSYIEGKPIAVRETKVKVPESIDVQQLRAVSGLTQKAFAQRYGFTLGAVRDWEQGRRTPERSARILLRVIEQAPSVVERALST
ncbi:MAG: putative transcriptional regulator [Oceanospirillaceae bacterium]|jgi:putative transcriptional regulator